MLCQLVRLVEHFSLLFDSFHYSSITVLAMLGVSAKGKSLESLEVKVVWVMVVVEPY